MQDTIPIELLLFDGLVKEVMLLFFCQHALLRGGLLGWVAMSLGGASGAPLFVGLQGMQFNFLELVSPGCHEGVPGRIVSHGPCEDLAREF